MRLLKSVWIWAAIATAAFAQTSSITGVVMDQSKAIIPNAKVLVTSSDTGQEYKTTTNSSGYYTVASLPALNYTVSAEAPGLKKMVSDTFKLDAASILRIDLTLVPADALQKIEVTAAAPA